MKEFEKWSKTPTGFAESKSEYAEGEAAWRAALEMLYSKLKQITDPSNCRCLLSVQEIIEEELQE